MRIYSKQMIANVQRHQQDFYSIESKMAYLTAKIRNLQDVMAQHPRNRRLKVVLNEVIGYRHRCLNKLRRQDYKKYEWLLEKLNIVYKPVPEELIRIERKASLRKLTDAHCDGIRQQRLDEYRQQLENQQLDFLARKLKNLEFIRSEQMTCQVKVTVTEAEIKQVRAQYEALAKERKKQEEDDEKTRAEM